MAHRYYVPLVKGIVEGTVVGTSFANLAKLWYILFREPTPQETAILEATAVSSIPALFMCIFVAVLLGKLRNESNKEKTQ